jgi:ELWxxDGT repeat protein
MKTSFWRRWLKSVRGTKQTGPVARAKPWRALLCLEALEERVTPSLTPQMVLDINPISLSSNPSQMVAIGSTTYFTADDGVNGFELWKSDGSETGTVLVKDINPGGGSSIFDIAYYSNKSLTNVNGTLFFTADDGTHGLELWKSDGTATGTVLVKDINPDSNGYLGSSPRYLTNVNGTLFFTADDGTHGLELWKSDGTAAGTSLVKDISTGGSGSYPTYLTSVNGTLFFTADDGTHGAELWKSDGTAAGTVLLKDIRSGSTGSYPSYLTNVNGTLFFTAADGTHGRELWKSDGTAAGTSLVKDISTGGWGSYPTYLTSVNGTLFFTADDGIHGYELWKSDGTAAGTVLVKDIRSGSATSYPTYLTDVNGTLFFSAYDSANGTELWKSDGTEAGTVLVKDIYAGSFSSGFRYLTNVNGTLFFSGNNGVNGTELWQSDGTEAGTVLVKDIRSGSASSYPTYLTNVNGTLFFRAEDGTHRAELWKSDGTVAGTTLVKDVNTITSGSSPIGLTDVNGTLFFSASDGVNGAELWQSDSTAAGTVLVKDINPYSNGYLGSSPRYLTNVNGTLFFRAEDGTHGTELWQSDGTAAGTTLVKDIYPGWHIEYYPGYFGIISRVVVSSSSPRYLTNVNGTLFFTAEDGIHGRELWQSDGTEAGTTLVKDIRPGGYTNYGYHPFSSSPRYLTNVNGTLFFTADDDVNGVELWKSDGTEGGTTLVKDIYPGTIQFYLSDFPRASSPRYLTNVNGTLFFTAEDGTNGRELWKSDGTVAGTVLVKDINPGSASSAPTSLTNVDGTLFFTAGDGTNGRELWQSDGTAAGTVLIKDIRPGSASSSPSQVTNVNGTLFFSAYDGTNGAELWRSDGTEAGTVLVKDIYAGSFSSFPSDLTNVNGTLFFTANDGAGSGKLWQSDGTDAGTVLVANLSASALTDVGGTLFFSAHDGIHGTELWALVEDGATQGTSLEVSGFPATITAGAAGSVTVIVKNADDTTDTEYRGTIRFTSSDPQALLPANYTFTEADQGVHTFSPILKTAGSQSITARDTVAPLSAGTQAGIIVNPAVASTLTIAGFPSPVTAGVGGSLTVTARDAYGNRASGYTGTVRFTSSDAQAVLPGTYTFTASDAGTHTFSATLKTAGYQSLTATDAANGALTGAQGSILVNAAAASRLILSAPNSVKANTAFSVTVTVVDAYGNVVTDYTGTLSFSSSDATARLPKKYTFTAADQGMHTFSGLRLKKKGNQTITVTDTLDNSLTASLSLVVS